MCTFSLTSTTKSSGGKLLGISGNEETGAPIPDTGKYESNLWSLLIECFF